MARLTKTQAAYFAGVFDGEGCVQAYYNGPSQRGIGMRLTVSNTNREIVDVLQATFGGVIEDRMQQQAHHKQHWNWRISGDSAVMFAREILPYLVIKRRQMELYLMLRNLVYNGGQGAVLTSRQVKQRDKLVAQIKKEKLRG